MEGLKGVDYLKITTVVDNYAEKGTSFLAQHGLSLFIEVKSNKSAVKILLDTGQSSSTLLYNTRLLNINPNSVDLIFLSHCHNDHTGGILGLLNEIDKKVPVVAHPEIFRENYNFQGIISSKGISEENSRENIIKKGGQIILIKEPFQIYDGVISSGEVERMTDFESKGIGTFNLKEGILMPDDLKDDMSIIVNIKNKGLFIIAGCSHSGILNIINHSIKITGNKKIYGIMGGLHLVGSSKEKIKKTISGITDFNPEKIVVGHCTGLEAIAEFSSVFGEKFSYMHVGKTIEVFS
ncbi:MAG: MBL fold metallo-hydrolase [Candidatus Atribacteria bacterium]|nr:MBL fold metallo-hydrolase [Candidatus Atribacteria bacterium]